MPIKAVAPGADPRVADPDGMNYIYQFCVQPEIKDICSRLYKPEPVTKSFDGDVPVIETELPSAFLDLNISAIVEVSSPDMSDDEWKIFRKYLAFGSIMTELQDGTSQTISADVDYFEESENDYSSSAAGVFYLNHHLQLVCRPDGTIVSSDGSSTTARIAFSVQINSVVPWEIKRQIDVTCQYRTLILAMPYDKDPFVGITWENAYFDKELVYA